MLIFDQLRKSDRPLQVLSGGVLAGMLILLSGLWYVQVASSQRYVETMRNQSFRSVRIPAVRGQVLDRNRQPLAESRPNYNLNLYLEELREHFQRKWGEIRPPVKLTRAARLELEQRGRFLVVSNLVAQMNTFPLDLPAVTEAQLHRHFTNKLALPMALMENLSLEQVARFMEQGGGLPGLEVETMPVRTYPEATVAAHILGYLNRDNSSAEDEEAFFNYRLPDYSGKAGLEAVFDRALRGRAGVKNMLVNNLGYRQSEELVTPAEPGHNVVLTLDLEIQREAERALHGQRGAVVVMDPHTGDVLALVSAPSFDPNSFIPRMTHKEWERLDDETLRPMINRATQERYPPGSIFKIIVALAALDAGTLHPHELLNNPGYFQLGKRRIHDTARPGDYDFIKAFLASSNYYFITQGLRCGIKRIVGMGNRFHLGEVTSVLARQEVEGEFPTLQQVSHAWSDGDTANLSIGQGPITVTPIQMAVMTSTIANGGKVMWPRIVKSIEPPEFRPDDPRTDFPAARVREELNVKPQHLQLLRDAMLADVEDPRGTGRRSAVPGMRVCGKTGTAEVKQGHQRVDQITWFVSFAPYEDPRYTVVVMIESGVSGGSSCAPVAEQIYRFLKNYVPGAAKERKTPATTGGKP